jgi:hypothetical protein
VERTWNREASLRAEEYRTEPNLMGNAADCCSSREKEDGLIQDAAAYRVKPSEATFRVTLTRTTPSHRLGVETFQEKSAVKILKIFEGQLVHDWNLQHRSAQVRVNDRIIAVNGEMGKSEKLLQLMESWDNLELLVSRQVCPVQSLDGFWRNRENDTLCIERGKIKWAKQHEEWTLQMQDVETVLAHDLHGGEYQGALVAGEIHWEDDDVWVRDVASMCQRYFVDNRVLGATSLGMAFRRSPNLGDRVSEEQAGYAKWGTYLTGRDLDNGWVCVDDEYYLPTHVDGVLVLTPIDTDTPTRSPKVNELSDVDVDSPVTTGLEDAEVEAVASSQDNDPDRAENV